MLDKLFGLTKAKTSVKTEIMAGVATFLTMAYITVVNPAILSTEGSGMDFGAVFTATIIAAVVGTLIMGLWANWPVALAPGMGLNAFFTFGVIFGMGYTFQQALAAVFVAGIVFIGLSVTPARKYIHQFNSEKYETRRWGRHRIIPCHYRLQERRDRS